MINRMFPHTVTIYNVVTETDRSTLKDTDRNYVTILRGVLLDATKAANVLKSGMSGADAVQLYIPFDVDARDGITGKRKKYVTPLAFDRAADKSVLWTMSLDGEGEADSFFINGAIVEESLSFEGVSLKYDGVYNITKVDEKNMGSLKHWEVGGA